MQRLVLLFTLLLSIPVFAQEKLRSLADIYDPTFAYFLDNWSDAATPQQLRLYKSEGI